MLDLALFVTRGETDTCVNLTACGTGLAFQHDDVADDAAALLLTGASVGDFTEFDTVGGGKFDSGAAIGEVAVRAGGEEGDFDVAQGKVRPRIGNFDA